METLRPLATELSQRHRVLIYDRRNCGASDVVIGGELSEQEIWAEDLHLLLSHLGMAPAYVGGISAGCRVSLLLAIRHPEDVRGLLLWWVTGGRVAAEQLGHLYYTQFIEAAQRGGMAAVIETPFFAERIQQNPSNRERLLAMNAEQFCAVMNRWKGFFDEGADLPVIGATAEELSRINVPTIIVPGDDEIHPRAVGEHLYSLMPQSELVSDLFSPEELAAWREEGIDVLLANLASRLAPVFNDFLQRTEAAKV